MKDYKITQKVGNLETVQGFPDYNNLIAVNSVFSNFPSYHPVDRTGVVTHPVKWSIKRTWQVPQRRLTLDQAMENRVHRLVGLGQKINIFWSGGIDSTAIVTAFLRHARDLSQVRIVYSPWSCYEHPEYMDFLNGFPAVEKIDQSGVRYLDLDLDGIWISGNSGDEMHASIDESFINNYGYEGLYGPWRDFFWQRLPDDKFMEFCERYFAKSGLSIQTVLEARWWFYAACKATSILRDQTVPFLLTNQHHAINLRSLHGFYDCEEYENFIYWNIPAVMERADYASWKQILKNYCRDFDGFTGWCEQKTKFHSGQITIYTHKKAIMNDQRYLLILEDGTKISTPNLPFFSDLEWHETHSSSLDYLFNEPDQI